MNSIVLASCSLVIGVYLALVADHAYKCLSLVEASYKIKQEYYACESALWWAIAYYKHTHKTMQFPYTVYCAIDNALVADITFDIKNEQIFITALLEYPRAKKISCIIQKEPKKGLNDQEKLYIKAWNVCI